MKKYAFANVKIPLEILSNGNFELLKQHIQVEFTQCKELPPKQELNVDFSVILNDLFKQEKINMNIEKEEEREIKIKEFSEDCGIDNDYEEQPHCSDNEEEQSSTLEYREHSEELLVLASEIKTNKDKRKNTSFKNRKNSHNYTNKVNY